MTTILITDDSLFQRRVIASILSDAGYGLLEAKNGVECLDIAKDKKPDLILLDLLMPELDGFGVLKKLKSEKIEIPVVVLTSDVQSTTREECIADGAVAYINKPVQETELISTINNVLKNR